MWVWWAGGQRAARIIRLRASCFLPQRISEKLEKMSIALVLAFWFWRLWGGGK